MKSLHTILYTLWAFIGFVQLSAAQDTVGAIEAVPVLEAKQLHRAAVDDFASGAYLRAADGFVAADRLTPRAGFLFNIAKSYDAANEHAHALAAYRGYLHEVPAAPDAAQVAERVSTLSAERARPGVQQVSILSRPLGAQVFVDEALVGVTPITLDLTFGAHTISLSLPGYRSVSTNITAADEPPSDLSIPLDVLDSAAPIPVQPSEAAQALARIEATPTPAPVRTPTKKDFVAIDSGLQIGGFASLGAGVVALGASVAFEVLRASTERSARRESVQTQLVRDLETIETQQTLARVFAGSGAVLAAVGGVLLGLAYAPSERQPTTELSMSCTPSRCQGVVSGAF
ncbi:MAG TPA: PEGA domain-containing protein [Polyangiales bacterium]|nr:PEGA domain-containing protein [Polyangiales bacterium]